MKHNTVNLVKFKSLCRRLKLPQAWGVGVLESLWLFAQHNAKDGDLTRYTTEDIAAWMDYPGDADELISALVGTGWLDQDEDGLRIHDWHEHAPNYLKASIAAKAKRDAKSGRNCEPSPQDSPKDPSKDRPQDYPKDHPKDPSEDPPPNQTKPNQTKRQGPAPQNGEWESTPLGCSRTWFFYRRGNPGALETKDGVLAELEELERLGVDMRLIMDAIKDPARDKSQQWWMFRRDYIDRPDGPVKKAQQAAQEARRIAEIEKRQLESAKAAKTPQRSPEEIERERAICLDNLMNRRMRLKQEEERKRVEREAAEVAAAQPDGRTWGPGVGPQVGERTGVLPLSATG